MSVFPPVAFCAHTSPRFLEAPASRHSAPVCALSNSPPPTPSSRPNPSRNIPAPERHADPLAPQETTTLLSRMLQIAVENEDYNQAALLRDARQSLLQQDPTYKLQNALSAAVSEQNFAECTRLRDKIELQSVLTTAESHLPKFPMGLMVIHKRLGHRMVVFGADHRCRAPRRKAEEAGVLFMRRGEQQPWYHAAVDERDKTTGDNIVYVAEDDCVPAPAGMDIQHPITRIMFQGIYDEETCPGYSCYIPSSSGLED